MIIIIFGLPGSGKSYFATKLATELEAKYISSDVLRKKVFADRKYTDEEKMKVYELMMKEMKIAIRKNENLILDATFYSKKIRNKFNDVAELFKVKIIFIEVWADKKIIFNRLGIKRADSEADYSVHLQIKEIFEPMESNHLIIESTQDNIIEMIDLSLNYIQNKNE